MNSALAVARREVKTFFSSPIAYIVLGGFLVLTGWFYFAPLFERGEASLRTFFSVAGLCFLLLVPAVTMRAIAEERKSGTLELLLTMPVQDWQVVVGKFMAALGMVWRRPAVHRFPTRNLTVSFSLTVAPGAAFDWGPVVAGYVGLDCCWRRRSSRWACGRARSRRTRSSASSSRWSCCAAFFLIGNFAVLLPESLGAIVEYISLESHFESIARGVFDSRDILYYLSVTSAGLLLTTQLLSNIRREVSTASVASPTIFTLAVVGSLVLLNVLSIRVFTRFDVTADHAYTLAPATKSTLASLDDQVTITAYFTKDLPAPYSSSARYVQDTLEEFRSASKGKVSFEFIDPAAQETDKDKEAKREVKQDIFGRRFREQTAQEKELGAAGIQSVEIRVVQDDQQQTKRAYLGLVLRNGEKKEVIPVVQNLSSLEYDLTSLIRKLVRTKTPVIGLLQGHDEPKIEEHLRQLHSTLSQTYEVRPVTMNAQGQFDPDIDALYVLGPKKAIPENELKAIDAMVQAGKPVAFFIDSVSIDLRTFQQTPAESGVGQLLTAYGINLSDQMVADVSSANLNISEQRGFMQVQMPVPYPFIPIVKHLEADSPITKGLGEVTFPFANKVTGTSADGHEVVVLARSSPKSWLEGKPQNLDPRRDWRSETITPIGSQEPGHGAVEWPLQEPVRHAAQGRRAHHRRRHLGALAGRLHVAPERRAGDERVRLAAARPRAARDALTRPAARPAQDRAQRRHAQRGESSVTRSGLPLALALVGLLRWRMRESRRASISL